MNKGTKSFFASLMSVGLVLSGAAAVSAQSLTADVNADASALTSVVKANVGAHLNINTDNIKSRADTEISNRIDSLNKLLARLQGMKHVTTDEQASISANLQSQISMLTQLKSSIDSETSTTSLKTDVQSITAAYRIYLLVIPQAVITAASDRVSTVASAMTDLGTKLNTRIQAAQTGGTDVSAATAAYADFQAKVADAQAQGQAAVNAVAGLKPDNRDQATLQANLAALKSGRSKIMAAQQDLIAARKDVNTILKTLHISASASASSTAAAGAQ